MTACVGPQPGEETCPYCEPIGVFGVVSAANPGYIGGLVDDRGIRHDPLRHQDVCPTQPQPEWE